MPVEFFYVCLTDDQGLETIVKASRDRAQVQAADDEFQHWFQPLITKPVEKEI